MDVAPLLRGHVPLCPTQAVPPRRTPCLHAARPVGPNGRVFVVWQKCGDDMHSSDQKRKRKKKTHPIHDVRPTLWCVPVDGSTAAWTQIIVDPCMIAWPLSNIMAPVGTRYLACMPDAQPAVHARVHDRLGVAREAHATQRVRCA